MTQKEQVRRLLNGEMYPYSHVDVARVLHIPIASVRRILHELGQSCVAAVAEARHD